MLKKGLVSIIIPVYNTERFLLNSVGSVLKQSYRNIELIVIDDGSTDNSRNVLQKMCVNDSRIHYIYQENKGVSVARNLGLKRASGEFITFLDSDDMYDECFIEKMIKKIGENDICYTGHFTKDENQKLIKSRMNFSSRNVIELYFLNKTTPHTNSWLIKKEIIDKNSLFFNESLSWGEDMLFFAKLLTLSEKITFCSEYLTIYNIGRSDSLSINSLNKIDKDILWIEEYINFLLSVNEDKKKTERILNAILGYRLPALIIYRLYKNIDKVDKGIYKKYLVNINKFKFNNGIRSMKLLIYKKKLERKISY